MYLPKLRSICNLLMLKILDSKNEIINSIKKFLARPYDVDRKQALNKGNKNLVVDQLPNEHVLNESSKSMLHAVLRSKKEL